MRRDQLRRARHRRQGQPLPANLAEQLLTPTRRCCRRLHLQPQPAPAPAPRLKTWRTLSSLSSALPFEAAPEIFGLHENADDHLRPERDVLHVRDDPVSPTHDRRGRRQSRATRSRSRSLRASPPSCRPTLTSRRRRRSSRSPTSGSVNTVLTQECIRYNNLIVVMRRTLQESLKALKGLVVMTDELEAVASSIFDNQVPDAWASKAYPSLKPCRRGCWTCWSASSSSTGGSITARPGLLDQRIVLPTQAFLTGRLQNYARKKQFAIGGTLSSRTLKPTKTQLNRRRTAATSPVFLEGARWDYDTHLLTESRPKELYRGFPADVARAVQRPRGTDGGVYNCPAYKTLTRAGGLVHHRTLHQLRDVPGGAHG